MTNVADTHREVARLAMCDQLEAEAAQWLGIVNAATAQLVKVIATAIDTDAWSGWGIKSPAHWASLRFGLSPARAKRLVAAAEALVGLPEVAAAFDAGELTEDHLSVIASAAPTPDNAATVVELARSATVSQLRDALRGIPSTKHGSPSTQPDAGAPEPQRPEQPASLSSWFDDDGHWKLRANGPATDGAIIDKALSAAGDRLFRERFGDDADLALRQAITGFDALVYLSKVGLDVLDPTTSRSTGRAPSERFLVNVHLRLDNPDAGSLHLGPLLPAHLRHEATCDALRRLWLEDRQGNVNLGRAARVVNAKLRTVLEHRDHRCRYPGCSRTRGLVAHHIVHWEHGGATDTANLVLLCSEHHRAVHQGWFRLHGNPDGQLVFTDPTGRRLGPLPPQPPGKPAAEAAASAGAPIPAWRNRTGEPGQWHLVAWAEPTDPDVPDERYRCTVPDTDDDSPWPDVWPDVWHGVWHNG